MRLTSTRMERSLCAPNPETPAVDRSGGRARPCRRSRLWEQPQELLRQQARVHHQAATITPRRLADFLAQVQAHERVLVQRLRDQEARGVLECIGAGGEASSPDTRASTPPEVLAWEPVDLAMLPAYEEYR